MPTPTPEETAVEQANAAFYRAFEKKDLTALTDICSQSIDSLCIHPGRTALKGWPAISASWQKIFQATQYLEIDTDIQSIQVTGDLAYVVLIENVRQVSGRRQAKARSMATNIFERMGGHWYLVHHHGSPLAQ
ncbi:MAG: nuclear transport factor 2 family protein [Cyanobacteria bacterium J06632_22]